MQLRQRLPKLAACSCATAAAFVTLVLSVPDAARAQSSQNSQAAKADMLARQRALWSLEEMNRRLSKKPREKYAANREEVYRQLAEDFQQLQLRNYDLAGAALPGVALDYELISKESSEVRRRAERLKTHLALPDAHGEEKVTEVQTPEELRAAIASLDAAVNSFAWNPVFQQPNVLDAQQSVKARLDLERILALSERIRRCAESLGKSSRQD